MTTKRTPAEIAVTASTCRTSAGADFYPRRRIETGLVCWYYAPRLRDGVETAAPWCSASTRDQQPLFSQIRNEELSENLSGGTPCPECNAKWSMT